MRYSEILNERKLTISDDERRELLNFLFKWLNGSYMHNGREVPSSIYGYWERLSALFPPRVNKPLTLLRLVILPVRYANVKSFHLDKPAPGLVGSWSSVPFGIESVAGITSDPDDASTARMVIKAKISPENIVATPKTIIRAIRSLTHDYDFDHHANDDGTYNEYLGSTDEEFHDNIGSHLAFTNIPGGNMRQYEYVVRTTPLDVTVARIYRTGLETHHVGHDDPHNSDGYRGWLREAELTERSFPDSKGRPIEVIENPSLRTLARMIANEEVMRGAVFRDGRFAIWDGMKAGHYDMRSMGQMEFLFVFYDSLDLLEMDCDWTMGTIWQNETVFFVCSHMNKNEMEAYPALRGSRPIGTFSGKGTEMRYGVTLRHDYIPDA